VQCDSPEPIPLLGNEYDQPFSSYYIYAWFMVLVYPVGVPLLFVGVLRSHNSPRNNHQLWNKEVDGLYTPDHKMEARYGMLYTQVRDRKRPVCVRACMRGCVQMCARVRESEVSLSGAAER
jgi:hypothetical protein